MGTILLINRKGELHPFKLNGDRLPADGRWNWAVDSLSKVLLEWQQTQQICPALNQQFTNNHGFLIITERDLTDVYRHFLEFPESEIALAAPELRARAAASIDQTLRNGQHCYALAFAATPYSGAEAQTLIPGSPYREGANIVAHELMHAGDRNADKSTGRHSLSPLFEMVMMLDSFQSKNQSAEAHTKTFYRQLRVDPGETLKEETLARMVENIVRNPDGEFHPLVQAYVTKVFFKDMEFKAAGREDLRAALFHEMTDFVQNTHHPLHPLYESMVHPEREINAQRVADATLDFINTISSRIGADAGPSGPRAGSVRPR